ncbi:MAG: ribonuclease P protein component [Bacteroidetes bacterium]|jgi:ribonuclease P protein component|nr:ribonuclease P protein component [Bacteroidota bacterium]
MNNKYPKEEKLKGRKEISELFARGESLFFYPIKWIYLEKDAVRVPTVRMGVSVPRRLWKRAVDRNRIKRKLREVYRLNKSKLVYTLSNKGHLNGMLVFVGREDVAYSELEFAFQNIVNQWLNLRAS